MPKQYGVPYHPSRVKVYFAIRDFWEKNNCAPTYRDIEKDTGLGVSNVYWHASRLRVLGLLEPADAQSRSLIIVGTKVVLPPVHEDFVEYYQGDSDKNDVELK